MSDLKARPVEYYRQFADYLPQAREALVEIDGFLAQTPGWKQRSESS